MILSCLRLGLTLEDFKCLKVGTILDIMIENVNQIEATKQEQEKPNDVRKAYKGESIASFFR